MDQDKQNKQSMSELLNSIRDKQVGGDSWDKELLGFDKLETELGTGNNNVSNVETSPNQLLPNPAGKILLPIISSAVAIVLVVGGFIYSNSMNTNSGKVAEASDSGVIQSVKSLTANVGVGLSVISSTALEVPENLLSAVRYASFTFQTEGNQLAIVFERGARIFFRDMQGLFNNIFEGFRTSTDVVRTSSATVWQGMKNIISTRNVESSFEMKDSATDEIYCVMITEGRWNKVSGGCDK